MSYDTTTELQTSIGLKLNSLTLETNMIEELTSLISAFCRKKNHLPNINKNPITSIIHTRNIK